jgi:hypothetical protein
MQFIKNAAPPENRGVLRGRSSLYFLFTGWLVMKANFLSELGIRDILVRIRIRIPGSVPLANGSGLGSGSGSGSNSGSDSFPPFFDDFKDVKKLFIFHIFSYNLPTVPYIIFSLVKICVKILFCQELFQSAQDIYGKREGSGSIPLTNGSGFGSVRPKNMRILGIQIRFRIRFPNISLFLSVHSHHMQIVNSQPNIHHTPKPPASFS